MRSLLFSITFALITLVVLTLAFPAKPKAQEASATSLFSSSTETSVMRISAHKDYAEETRYSHAQSIQTLLGANVQDGAGKSIALVHDVIIVNGDDRDDNEAEFLILSDGTQFGIPGRMVALDYDDAVKSEPRRETLRRINTADTDDVIAFDYSIVQNGGDTRFLRLDEISVRNTIGTPIYGTKMDQVGMVADITLKNGKADLIVFIPTPVMGMGVDPVALFYDQTLIVSAADGHNAFRLSPEQDAALNNHRSALRTF
ncbi:hypothetical protein [Micavibrio aeruginosavorus]|uniref:hypothetical protein n=1 Tax=Micavibrio aeruginosavorus TaxID=349221 RepID=UPI003F4ABAB5